MSIVDRWAKSCERWHYKDRRNGTLRPWPFTQGEWDYMPNHTAQKWMGELYKWERHYIDGWVYYEHR